MNTARFVTNTCILQSHQQFSWRLRLVKCTLIYLPLTVILKLWCYLWCNSMRPLRTFKCRLKCCMHEICYTRYGLKSTDAFRWVYRFDLYVEYRVSAYIIIYGWIILILATFKLYQSIDNNFSCITIYCGYKFSCKSTTQLKNYACHLLKTNIVIYMMTHLPFIRLHFLSHNVRNVLSKWRCVLRRHDLALSK